MMVMFEGMKGVLPLPVDRPKGFDGTGLLLGARHILLAVVES